MKARRADRTAPVRGQGSADPDAVSATGPIASRAARRLRGGRAGRPRRSTGSPRPRDCAPTTTQSPRRSTVGFARRGRAAGGPAVGPRHSLSQTRASRAGRSALQGPPRRMVATCGRMSRTTPDAGLFVSKNHSGYEPKPAIRRRSKGKAEGFQDPVVAAPLRGEVFAPEARLLSARLARTNAATAAFWSYATTPKPIARRRPADHRPITREQQA